MKNGGAKKTIIISLCLALAPSTAQRVTPYFRKTDAISDKHSDGGVCFTYVGRRRRQMLCGICISFMAPGILINNKRTVDLVRTKWKRIPAVYLYGHIKSLVRTDI